VPAAVVHPGKCGDPAPRPGDRAAAGQCRRCDRCREPGRVGGRRRVRGVVADGAPGAHCGRRSVAARADTHEAVGDRRDAVSLGPLDPRRRHLEALGSVANLVRRLFPRRSREPARSVTGPYRRLRARMARRADSSAPRHSRAGGDRRQRRTRPASGPRCRRRGSRSTSGIWLPSPTP
jgi:hypothetical protein